MPDTTQAWTPAGILRAIVVVALVAGVSVLCCFTIDVPAAAWSKAHTSHLPSLVKNVLAASRVFGQFFSVLFVAALILSLEPARRRDVGLFIITMIAATLVVHLTKAVTGRLRPLAYLDQLKTLGAGVALQGQSTWHLLKGFTTRRYDSFPSAHSAAAFAMAAVLLRMYPRAAWLFLTTAALCAISRVADTQHYPSDVIVGGAVGLWIGLKTGRWRWSVRAADWIETQNVRNIAWLEARLGRRNPHDATPE